MDSKGKEKIMKKQIEPDEVVGGAIAIYNNVWQDYAEDINSIRFILEDKNLGVDFKPSGIMDDIDNKINSEKLVRTSSEMFITGSSHKSIHLKNMHKKSSEIIDSSIESYKKLFSIENQIFNIEGFQLLKYENGGYFKEHYDSSAQLKRAISVLIYLNDDYEGGEIEFVNFGIKIKPKAGTLILFPSNYPYKHAAHPVTSGTKYVIVTWLHER